MYTDCLIKKLLELVNDVGVIYRIDTSALINLEIFDKYLEKFHETKDSYPPREKIYDVRKPLCLSRRLKLDICNSHADNVLVVIFSDFSYTAYSSLSFVHFLARLNLEIARYSFYF